MPLPPPRRARTTSAENPFASFYESRRKISLEADDDDTADPSSSITRAYTVPDALLALARGERESSPAIISSPVISNPVITSPVSTRRMVATDRADVSTHSTSMFPFRSSPRLGVAEWRAVQRIALSAAGWLRRVWRRSIPN